ncbi:hypothetical protein DYB35_013554, partial [Aphanomyces astaci]
NPGFPLKTPHILPSVSRRSSLQVSQPTPSSTPLTTRVTSQDVALLENLDQQRYAKRVRYSTVIADEPDDLDSNSPIYDSFLASQGAERIVIMTNFSEYRLWTKVGGICSLPAVDAVQFVKALRYLGRRCGGIQAKTDFLQEARHILPDRFHPYLMRRFVTAVEQKWTMQALAESGHRFKNFPAARYATNVTFQQTNVEVSVVPNGFAIDCTKFYKGSVSDKTIFDENIDSHLANLAKRTGETTLEDLEPGMEQWAVLADKGCQGIQHNVWAVLPLKKPVGGILTFAEQAKNDRIASDRVIVENYFGRLKTFWATCSKYVPLEPQELRHCVPSVFGPDQRPCPPPSPACRRW